MSENLKPVALGKVITALLIWTCDETRNVELAKQTMRALPIETLHSIVANMKSIVELAKPIIEDRSEPKVRP